MTRWTSSISGTSSITTDPRWPAVEIVSFPQPSMRCRSERVKDASVIRASGMSWPRRARTPSRMISRRVVSR